MESVPHDVGPRLRTMRIEKGHSLSAFARRVFYTKGYLSRVETGLQLPSLEFIRRCEAELDAPGELVPPAGTSATSATSVQSPAAAAPGDDEVWLMTMAPIGSAFTPITRREALLGGIAAGTALARWSTPVADPGDCVARHRQIFDATRELGQSAPPSVVMPMLVGQAQALRRLSASTPARVGIEVAVLAARTAEFAGWMAQEDGDDAAALWWTDRAVEVATAVGDDYVASYALVRRALITLYRGDAPATIALASQARSRPGTPARIRGLAAQREAQGHALAGDYDACMRALDEAGRLLRDWQADAPTGPVIGTAHVTDPVAVVSGWCLYDLGRPREAAAVLDTEVPRIPSSAVRARTRFGARHALAHAASGEVEHACLLTRQIINNLAFVQSATILTDLRKLAKALRRWPKNPHVRALDPALTAALSPAA
ncbi:helix-turn-helix domain-containing protein [Labedaea rhizosphaerae]|uniref:Transcriptional regulator with XRE-family HTH domain n=1 Tax=Labedaea rhizosphaerae TaxID=598644 RepID=A0A4R6RUB4_LABRH|nr:helix-turn-helix transcriptional regulator [Labedaea rhizosphaerae]TDP89636.1 transcriptional regulator with XRE-family HTH domain [Labedaea rhizosphaerae]